MSEELKGCPFCGGTTTKQFKNCVVCERCHCFGPALRKGVPKESRDELIVKAWNRRAPVLREETMADVAEVLEALESWNQDVPIWSDEHMLDAALMAFRKVSEELKP